jgi:predicted HTH transcriptional regulator
MNDKKEVIAEIQRQIKFVEQVGSNLRMLCHAMEKEENQPEVKPTETLVEQNDRDEVDTLVELSEPKVEVKPRMLRTEFAVKMSNILANQVFSQHDLTTVLNKEGFATMFDVTPDKFQTILDNMERKHHEN